MSDIDFCSPEISESFVSNQYLLRWSNNSSPLWKVNYHTHKNLTLDSILRHVVQSTTSHYILLKFTLILSSNSSLCLPHHLTSRSSIRVSYCGDLAPDISYPDCGVHGFSPSRLINSGMEPQNTSRPLLYKIYSIIIHPFDATGRRSELYIT